MSLTDRIAEIAARLHGLPSFPQVEDDNIRLRCPCDDDILPLFAAFSDPDVMRYWSRAPMTAVDEAKAFIDSIHAGFAARQFINWIIADPDTDALLGTCTLYDLQIQHLRSGIGYALHPSHQGKGHASRAVSLACDWAFGYLNLHRIEADIHPDNAASRRVLLRCGFQNEGLLRQRFCNGQEMQDSEIYGRLADSQ